MTELNTDNANTIQPEISFVTKKGRDYAILQHHEAEASEFLDRNDAVAALASSVSKIKASLAESTADLFQDRPTTFRIQSNEQRAVDVIYTYARKAINKDLAAEVNKLPAAIRKLLVEEVVEVKLKPRDTAEQALELLEDLDPKLTAAFRAHLAPSITVKPATKSEL